MAWAWRISGLDQADTPVDWCSEKSSDLGTVANKVTSSAETVMSAWSKIRDDGTYSGPGDEQLFNSMTPVKIRCNKLAEDLGSLAKILETLQSELKDQKTKLTSLRSEATRLYQKTWEHDPDSDYYSGPRTGSYLSGWDYSGWDYKEYIDDTLTRWEYRSQYQDFIEKNADLCARINHAVNGYDDVVDECVRKINRIGWGPWWNPAGLTPQGPYYTVPQIDPNVAMEAEVALAAHSVNQATADGTLSEQEAAEIQSIFDNHTSDPEWMSQLVVYLGGGAVMTLLGQAGSNALADPNGPWIGLGQSVRSGVSVASQQWDQSTSQDYAKELVGSIGTTSGASVIGFLFADPENSAMGSELTMAMITDLATDEAQWGGTIVDHMAIPQGVGLAAGDESVTDPMGQLLSTLAVYPSDSLILFTDPSNAQIAQWLLGGRPYVDGFTGLTDAVLASQDPSAGGVESQMLVVSEVTMWLGHNPDLPSMSDEAKMNTINILAPYEEHFGGAESDVTDPGVYGADTNGQLTASDPITKVPITSLPILDSQGLQALVGRTSDTEEGKAAWMVVIEDVARDELSKASTLDSQDAQEKGMGTAETNYYWSVGYLTGASGKTAIDDGRSQDESNTWWTYYSDAALKAGGAWAGRAVGSYGGPVGTVVGGTIGGVIGGAIANGADQVIDQLNHAEADARAEQTQDAHEAEKGAFNAWQNYCTSLGYQLPTDNVITYEETQKSFSSGESTGMKEG